MTSPKDLPVYLHRQEITDALQANQVIIVESPTGSGKTTQIPLILKETGLFSDKIIGITQPRRIAAVGVCSYIQKQLEKEDLPFDYCAYKMRFYDTTGPSTKIKILTDGMLLQEIKADPDLLSYGVIMVDEAHERSLNIDFILGLLKDLTKRRKDLKIIISSATLNTKTFADFFKDDKGNKAPIISIPTRVYDVATKYYPVNADRESDFLSELVHSVCQIVNVLIKDFDKNKGNEGRDTLVFLPGELEIKTCIEALYSECDYSKLQIYPLYGRLNKEEQELVFTPTQKGKIKVVLATNIAETSLTIDGIRVVIDSGLAKINFYDQDNFTSALVSSKISKSSALQRQGRAGRTSDGWCYRLYSKEDFDQRRQYSIQEILRTDLSEVVLRMSDLGIYNPESFTYITKPDRQALISSVKTLRLIDAIDSQNHLTSTGELMVHFPLLPRHSRALVEAIRNYPDHIMAVIVCISFLSAKTPFLLPLGEEDAARMAHRRFASKYGDFISYQYIYRNYSERKTEEERDRFCSMNYLDRQSMDEIVHISMQLADIVREAGIPVMPLQDSFDETDSKAIISSLSSGLIQYLCIRKKGSVYRTLTADEVYIHPGSAWFTKPPLYLLAGEIVQTSRLYARTVSPIEEAWMKEIAPGLLSMIKRHEKEEKSKADKENKVREGSSKKKTVSFFGTQYETISKTIGKKHTDIVVLPADCLLKLAKTNKKASRHPNHFKCTVRLNSGHYCLFGETFANIMRLAGKVDFNSIPLKSVTSKVFFEDTLSQMVPYLNDLIKLAVMPKEKDKTGFVEIVTSSKGFFFHVNQSYSQALNNTAYSLLTLCDISPDNAFKDKYNALVHLLD